MASLGYMEGGTFAGVGWYLGNAEEEHEAQPRSFFIPGRAQRESLAGGDIARLLFYLANPAPDQPRAERMWVEVAETKSGRCMGTLMNQPTAIEHLAQGDTISFGPEHIIGLNDPRWAPFESRCAFVSRRLLEDDTLEPGLVVHDPSDEQLAPRSDGQRASGWQVLVGDETDEELSDPANVRVPNLAWLMERYPAFAELVFSGATSGGWVLDKGSGRYVPE